MNKRALIPVLGKLSDVVGCGWSFLVVKDSPEPKPENAAKYYDQGKTRLGTKLAQEHATH